jgi:hypothetical protein
MFLSVQDDNVEIYYISVDGMVFHVPEQKPPTLPPIDKGQFCKKYKHGALKYQIVLSVHKLGELD